MVRKLKAKEVPKSEIITINGHRQEQSVEAYDSGNEDEQRQLSNISDGKEIHFNQTTSRVRSPSAANPVHCSGEQWPRLQFPQM